MQTLRISSHSGTRRRYWRRAGPFETGAAHVYLIGDKGYDGDGFRAEIVNRGAKPVIPNKSNRVTLHSFSKRTYKGRNVIERCFCRLKDFRRVATRYDKLARTFLAAVHLAAIIAYWIVKSEP